ALAGLVRFRTRRPSRPFTTGVLLLTLALSGMMGWTANLGGQVRHTEIRPGAAAVSDDGRSNAGSHDDGGAEGSEYRDED
ncbi:MAG TPA: hypothetical protein VLL48_00605, partial [Longimicrobiales bacterium]|nr:hypothetical protein [Longimicrobiales bacterium]